ncbi:MAG: DNA mismatch repair endonuclease MutL, partial [Calditrichaeota bacterium]
MGKIQVLPPNIANKIAAGEVVERPASVVKELVENALDAGATHITVVISRAGKELIQVIDDGEGIPADEVELALERHATSKISTAEDLDRIGTLGFRGEALPSIASVSRFELKTRVRESEVGVLLRVDGGVIREKETVAAQPGTTVSVKNLFFNTPARRNFLRADSTEFNHIVKWMKRFFLAYPEVHFVLIHNGEELFHLPPGSLDERIVQVFGKAFYEGLAHFREELNDIVLEGYTCRPDQARGTAQNQFIFLNRRAIVNRSLNHAIQQGYGNLLERSRYPQYIMFLTIPPHLVDVNVHPTKMEVRFSNERAMYHLFLSGVRRAVQAQPGGVPSFTMKREHPSREEVQQHFRSSSGAAFPSPPSTPPSRPGDATSGQPPSPASPSQISFEYRPLPETPPKEPDASSLQSLSRGGPA